jgi:uncharacterized protein YabE (DUF348 family)
MIALGLLIVSTAWGIGSGHLPISPGATADTRVVSLYADGEKKIVSTDATTVGELLQRSGVTLGTGDIVEPAASTPITQGFFNVNVYRAKPVTIVDGDKTYHLLSAYSSPRLLAESAGITVYPADKYKSEVVTNFVDQTDIGVKLTIERSLPFTVTIGGVTTGYRAQPGTVAEALNSAGVPLGQQDTVSSPLSAPLTPNMALTIQRVNEVVTTVEEVLPAPTQTVQDANEPIGYSAVQTQGSDGHQTVKYRIHYTNGVETSRDALLTSDVVAATPTVTVVGIKVADATDAVTLGQQMAASRGWTGTEWTSLYQLWMHESGWNPSSTNGSSGACGIPQANPCSKMGGTDTAGQITWGLNYIAGRYGDPNTAWAYWLIHKSY